MGKVSKQKKSLVLKILNLIKINQFLDHNLQNTCQNASRTVIFVSFRNFYVYVKLIHFSGKLE